MVTMMSVEDRLGQCNKMGLLQYE